MAAPASLCCRTHNETLSVAAMCAYQWELSGPNGGDWWLIVNDGTYQMGRGKIPNPNVTFVASDEDWVAMSNKTLNVSLAYVTGRLKIQGSHRLVKELDKIFP